MKGWRSPATQYQQVRRKVTGHQQSYRDNGCEKNWREVGYRSWHQYMLWHFYFTRFWKNITCCSGPDSTKKMTLRYACGSLDSSLSNIHVNRLRIYLRSENNPQIWSTLLHNNSNLLDKFILTVIHFQTDHWMFWYRNSFQFHFSFINCYRCKYCLVLTYMIHFHIAIYIFLDICNTVKNMHYLYTLTPFLAWFGFFFMKVVLSARVKCTLLDIEFY